MKKHSDRSSILQLTSFAPPSFLIFHYTFFKQQFKMNQILENKCNYFPSFNTIQKFGHTNSFNRVESSKENRNCPQKPISGITEEINHFSFLLMSIFQHLKWRHPQIFYWYVSHTTIRKSDDLKFPYKRREISSGDIWRLLCEAKTLVDHDLIEAC